MKLLTAENCCQQQIGKLYSRRIPFSLRSFLIWKWFFFSLGASFCCSKIGKLTLARLLMAHNSLISYGCPDAGTESSYAEILSLYHDLMKMDPAHICHYEDEYSLVLLKQVNLLSFSWVFCLITTECFACVKCRENVVFHRGR